MSLLLAASLSLFTALEKKNIQQVRPSPGYNHNLKGPNFDNEMLRSAWYQHSDSPAQDSAVVKGLNRHFITFYSHKMNECTNQKVLSLAYVHTDMTLVFKALFFICWATGNAKYDNSYTILQFAYQVSGPWIKC